LIVAQIGLSLVLLLGAGLLVGSFQRLRTVNTGFQPQSVLEIQLNQKPLADEGVDNNVYRRQLLERISSLPGVMSASFSENDVPGEPQYNRDFVTLPSEAATNAHISANAVFISPNFFSTLGIRMLKGRDFSDADGERKATFGIVNRSLAARLFPDGDAVGKTVRYSVMPEFQSIEIIGVTDDARVMSLRDATVPVLYLSTRQDKTPGGNLFVRTTQAPEGFANVAAREIGSFGREYTVRSRTIDQIIGQGLVEERVIAALSGFFSGLALLLASIGLYGLMSFGVIRRTREIGIRVAVGAQRENILWMVLRETLTLAVIGIAIGVPTGIAAARLVASTLFGVTASDLPTITLVSCLLLGVSAAAGFLPALRASRVDPIEALRTD
jgi:predicted permease